MSELHVTGIPDPYQFQTPKIPSEYWSQLHGDNICTLTHNINSADDEVILCIYIYKFILYKYELQTIFCDEGLCEYWIPLHFNA